MTDKHLQDEAFAAQLADQLRQSEDAMDMATRSKLSRARYAALEQAQPTAFFSMPQWLAFGGSVCAALLVAMIFVNQVPPASQSSVDSLAAMPTGDVAIAIDNNLELYDDLEFYEWLAEIEHG
ncbi:hypothetical protein R50073_23580 [Maricurvus nonylphenolicus]|uniref:hypothetical protein n=1 Tax=Maricurvus nonylphenolicus TaxID=1008307 RepID=UPI0036F398B6